MRKILASDKAGKVGSKHEHTHLYDGEGRYRCVDIEVLRSCTQEEFLAQEDIDKELFATAQDKHTMIYFYEVDIVFLDEPEKETVH